jgi:hypothetical protein
MSRSDITQTTTQEVANTRTFTFTLTQGTHTASDEGQIKELPYRWKVEDRHRVATAVATGFK